MSLTQKTTVWCDGGVECLSLPVYAIMQGSTQVARSTLRKLGWTHVGRKDYCPACSAQLEVERLRETNARHRDAGTSDTAAIAELEAEVAECTPPAVPGGER